MTIAPTLNEQLARARADLRMGVPVVLSGSDPVAFVAAETLDPDRLRSLRAVSDESVLTITARRAETLRARAYDGDVARIRMPADADAAWVRSIADPAGDLMNPMKGPLSSLRTGDASAHRVAVRMVKSARLLPAAFVVSVPDAASFGGRDAGGADR